MSFRGGGRGRGGGGGGFNSGRGGGRGFGGRGGNRGGFGADRRNNPYDQGPPDKVIELGYFLHPAEAVVIVKCVLEDVPYFNAPIFLENKETIGKVDEIFGGIRDYMVSVILNDNFTPSSFKPGTKLFIDPMKLLPLKRFLPEAPKPQLEPKKKKPKGEGGRGGGRGRGRGSFRGGSGGRGAFGGGGFGGGRGGGGNRGGFGGQNRGRGGFSRGRGGGFNR